MANFTTYDGFPHILHVWGDGIETNSNRLEIIEEIKALNTGLISETGRNSHDFYYLYYPLNNREASLQYDDRNASPRPLRGIIRFKTITPKVHTLLHELTHHWIGTDRLRVNGDSMLSPEAFYELMKEPNSTVTSPTMIGRQTYHWSPYFQSDDSVMDGTRYVSSQRIDGLTKWTGSPIDQLTYQLSDTSPEIVEQWTYCDLDKWMVGVKSADNCYPDNNNSFQWIAPIVVGPRAFKAGILLTFSDNSFIQFGFDNEYDKLTVIRNGNEVLANIKIMDDYRPFDLHDGVVFRVVKTDTSYSFEARVDNRNESQGCLIFIFMPIIKILRKLSWFLPLDLPKALLKTWDVFDDSTVVEIDHGDNLLGGWVWRRVARLNLPDLTPVMIGQVLDRGQSSIIHYRFSALQIKTDEITTYDSFDVDASIIPWERGLIRNNPTVYLPTPGSQFWNDDNGGLFFGTPMSRETSGSDSPINSSNQFRLVSPTEDFALKALIKTPDSTNWSFASTGKLERLIVPMHLGGDMNSKYIIGKEHSVNMSQVSIGNEHDWRKAPPPNETYKVAHIVISKNESDVTRDEIKALDEQRRLLDACFQSVTDNTRYLDSSLG